jgi:hypothetical protein
MTVPDHDASPQGHVVNVAARAESIPNKEMTILQPPFTPQAHTTKELGGRQPPHVHNSMSSKGFQMLLNLSRTITDFIVLATRLTTEELADEQRIVLIDQFIHLQGLDAAFQFDLHDLLMFMITILIVIFWEAWDSADRWPYR